MRKLMFLFLSFVSLQVYAEGYQVNLLSAKQSAMGHVGTAMKLGAESMHFNPAGLVYIPRTVDFSLGMGAVASKARYENGNIHTSTDSKISTPVYAYAGFRIYDNLAGGIALTTPYGSSIDWGKNWAGATLIQNISLKAFCVQPTLSWKINNKFSIGAGLMIDWGNVNLSKGLISGATLAAMMPSLDWNPNVTPVSVTLNGDAGIKIGYNLGVMWSINDQWTLGASYRSNIKMKVERGDAYLSYADVNLRTLFETYAAELLPNIDAAEFQAELPLPANLTVGGTYQKGAWTTSLDLQYTFWSAYEELNIVFPYVIYKESTPYKNTTIKNYRNSLAIRLGAMYALTHRFDVRAGFYCDNTPVRSDYFNPETPGVTKLGTSAGFSFRPKEYFSIDCSVLYIAGIDRDGSMQTGVDTAGNPVYFKGRYSMQAWSPSLGISFSF